MLILVAALIAQLISQHKSSSINEGECSDKTIEDSVTEFQNELRSDFATKDVNSKYGDVPGSKSLFKLKYDCSLAALAAALISKDCKQVGYSAMGVSSNFRKFRTINKIEDKDVITYYNLTVEEWATKDIVPLNLMLSTRRKAWKILLIPKIGEPLYIPNPKPKNKKGCTAHKTCKEVVSDDRCMTNEDSTLGPLCESNPTEVDVETTSSTASTQSTSTTLTPTTSTTTTTTTLATETTTTTTSPTKTTTTTTTTPTTTTTTPTTGMTQEMRDKVIQMIHYRRYDMTLKAEAQAVADTCQVIASGVATTSGQNAYVMSSVTLPLYDVLVETQKVWWSQITKNGIYAQMHYTQFLETKPLSPSAFTQMAWAESYKVGCGIKRCSFGTSVVCRYSPR